MQTTFTTEQLADPDTKVSNQILRSCVHCGMCTATCPTFVLLGDELDSPRGRIYLIKDMLESGRPATEEVVRHVDRCLSCLSCMTTCPSGVNYMHLVDHARTYIERTYERPADQKWLRDLLSRVLPRPRVLRAALKAAQAAKPFRWLLPRRTRLGRQLDAMLDLAPAKIPPRQCRCSGRRVHPAQGVRRGRVALLVGCAQTVLDPAINESTIRLLTRLGIEVVIPRQVGCCGALTHHMGKHERAMASARDQHGRLGPRDRRRRAGRDRRQHVWLRHHGERLRLHVPRGAGPRSACRAGLGPDQGRVGISGRHRLRADCDAHRICV